MNKINIIMLIVTFGIILYIGGIIYYEQVIQLENNPDIKEFGGPPVITDLRLMVAVIVTAAIVCIIALLVKPKEETDEVKEK